MKLEEYHEVLDRFRSVSSRFRLAQGRYLSREISEEEYLAIRHEMDAIGLECDKAEREYVETLEN